MNHRVALAVCAILLVGGCATQPPPPAPLSADSGATAFAARALTDPALRRFLAENLGHEPPSVDGTWDLESLAWVAFYYHPSLEVARAQLATARAAQQTASARSNPTVSLVPGYNTSREPGISPWFPGINLDFPLLGSDKRTHQQAIARAEAEAARLSVVSAAWQVRSELRRAFLEFHSAAARLTPLRAQAATQKQLVARLEQRLAVGRLTAGEVSSARLAHLRSEAAVADALSQSRAARTRIAAALGLPAAAVQDVAFASPPIPLALPSDALATARAQALRSRTDVLAALARYESTQAALALEVAKQQPDLHLGPGYQWDQGANKWSLGLTFELPVFHRNESVIAGAVSRRSEAAAQFNVVQSQAIAVLDAAVAARTAAATQRDHAQRLLDEASAQVARTQQRLDAGAAEQAELLTAQLDNAGAELSLAEATGAVALADGQLEDALQIPFRHLAALTP